MTSNAQRAAEEKTKYTKHTGKAEKQSYVNIQQIVKRINIKDGQLSKLDDEQFKELLEKFYNYQINLQPPKKEFLKIKAKEQKRLRKEKERRAAAKNDINKRKQGRIQREIAEYGKFDMNFFDN